MIRGHGTQPVNEELLATVCGVVERVNKLVSVRPLRARYFERFLVTISVWILPICSTILPIKPLL